MKKIVMTIAALSSLWILPAYGQENGKYEKLTLSIGGGISTPLNPTARYTGIGGIFSASAGYRINRRSSINGEFSYMGIPGDLYALQPANLPDLNSRVYFLGANYRYQIDRVGGSAFGVYTVLGGGWYDRYMTLNQDYTVPPGTVCTPIWGWYGYGCTGGYVSETIARKGTPGGGLNGGFGFTVRLGQSFKFFTEARYHYAFHGNIPTTMVPVTLGLRFN